MELGGCYCGEVESFVVSVHHIQYIIIIKESSMGDTPTPYPNQPLNQRQHLVQTETVSESQIGLSEAFRLISLRLFCTLNTVPTLLLHRL